MFNSLQGKHMAIKPTQLVALDREARTNLPTPEAALHLNRAQQTLRIWAMRENGPIRPIRIHGRLAWPVADLKRLLQAPQTVEARP